MANLESEISFLVHVCKLKFIPRTGWLLRGILNAENVASHSYGVVATAMLIADLDGESIDSSKLLKMAILHDLSETLVGDLAWSASSRLPGMAKREMEHSAFESIVEGLPFRDEYQQLWLEYASKSSREAVLLRDADSLETLIQAYVYEWVGYRSLDEFWNTRSEDTFTSPTAKSIFRALQVMRDKLRER